MIPQKSSASDNRMSWQLAMLLQKITAQFASDSSIAEELVVNKLKVQRPDVKLKPDPKKIKLGVK